MSGDRVSRNGMEYVAKYYNQGMDPATNHEEPNMSPAGKPWDVPKPC